MFMCILHDPRKNRINFCVFPSGEQMPQTSGCFPLTFLKNSRTHVKLGKILVLSIHVLELFSKTQNRTLAQVFAFVHILKQSSLLGLKKTTRF